MSDTIQERLRRMKLPPGYNQKALNEAADEIDRLRAELAEKDDVIFCFEAELKTANARIEELEAELEDHRQSNFCDYGCLDDEKGGA